MRVALLSSGRRDAVHGTGTAVAVAGLARGLEALGHEIVDVAPDPIPLPLPAALSRTVFNLRLAGPLAAAGADLAVGVDADGVLLPRRGRPPYVVLLKGVAADEARFERGASRLERRAAGLAEAVNARRADRVVVPSDYSAGEAILRYGVEPARVVVVPEGVDVEAWAALRRSPPAAPDPRPTVLSVARLYPRKNTGTLLDAFARVLDALPEARLRVVGGGRRRRALAARARHLGIGHAVRFLGGLPDAAAVRREYFRAWCFCLPTLQEAFGIAFLEAMAAGRPVVGPLAAAVPEVVAQGEAGILVEPHDADAVAGALLRLLRDPGLRERMGRRAAEAAGAFGLDASARAFVKAVEDLVGPDAAAPAGAVRPAATAASRGGSASASRPAPGA